MNFLESDNGKIRKCKILGMSLILMLQVFLLRSEVSSLLPLSFLLDKTSLFMTFINK